MPRLYEILIPRASRVEHFGARRSTLMMFTLQRHLDDLSAQTPRLALRAHTSAELQIWQSTLRSEIARLLGIAERQAAPVNAEKIASIDRGAYVEEKYRLDCGEHVQTPMYLLVPKGAPPFKPILAFHGHAASAQYMLGNFPDAATARAQLAIENNYAQALAQAGYLVCAIEQRGLSERTTNQVSDENPARSCRHLAFAYAMLGRTLIGERCWDGMCAIHYLQTRTDLAPHVLGCTGHSGGGTTALWLAAIDSRITTLVVSGYFCSFQDSLLAMRHCECNYVPGILARAEMGDLAALFAPRPLRAINGEADPLYPAFAARQQFETVKHAYALCHADEKCSLAIHSGEHAYHHQLAQEWFSKWL